MSLILLAQTKLGPIGADGKGGLGKYLTDGSSGTGITQIESILTMAIGFLTVVGGLAFLIYFIIGGLSWVTAGGNEKKVEDAKSYMTNGAIGLIVIVAAYAIVWIVGEVLGLNILNPSSLPFLNPSSREPNI